MSILIRTLEVSALLLLLLVQMQCIHGNSEVAQQPLLRLNEILTNRITNMLSKYKDLRNQSDNKESLQQYKRLAMAAGLPFAQLDEKIRAYNAYLAHDMMLQRNELASLFGNSSSANRIAPESNTAFEQRVVNILKRLGVYDRFTERVFRAIFSDEQQLMKLKKRLEELDDDEDNSPDCYLWDAVFGLF
ncbi:uncharacterized protein LOC6562607 [Drosophila grimshawi]|uniref:GH10977 n=1 Tax=Drosophila grimshawi TaxID=7222 RepID=B4JBM2_DROGR|nr:uncharacterized protein LOC6562607 [Drosophila grimshawi]EDW02957.1 GH10977 [Drosophila grimshawi]